MTLRKYILTGSVFAFACTYAMAQDRIVTKEGNTFDVYNVEIANRFIFYTENNSQDADILKMNKDDVLMIRFQDGTKTFFTDDARTQTEETVQNDNRSATVEENTVTDYSITAEENEMLKEKYRIPVEYIKKPSDKEAKSFYCQFDFCQDAVLADRNVEIELKSMKKEVEGHPLRAKYFMYGTNFALSITLRNKTDKIIYVDLGNSFFVRGDEASPLYVPSSTSVTGGSNSGAGVNVGSVTNALGIGGIAGTLAQGVTVGGGKSKYSTTVTYSQRYISIPPMSSTTLDPQLIYLPGNNPYNLEISRCTDDKNNGVCVYLKEFGLRRGDTLNWDETSSPVKIRSFIKYSLDSEFKETGQLNTSLYVKKMIGVPRLSGGYFIPTIDISSLSENFTQSLFYMGEFAK